LTGDYPAGLCQRRPLSEFIKSSPDWNDIRRSATHRNVNGMGSGRTAPRDAATCDEQFLRKTYAGGDRGITDA
jgi:hypothetical protein